MGQTISTNPELLINVLDNLGDRLKDEESITNSMADITSIIGKDAVKTDTVNIDTTLIK